MSLLVMARRISKLSELTIDADKDWRGKGITNIKQVAQGMSLGHLIQHNGVALESLPPGPASYVLTSAGPNQRVVWAPGGTYLYRYFPVVIDLTKNTDRPFTPNESKHLAAALSVPFGIEDRFNPGWFKRLEPQLYSSALASIFNADHDNSLSPIAADSLIQVEIPVSGAVADDGGAQTDETTGGKSGIIVDQQYSSNDDNQQGFSNSSYWEAQTFTTSLAQRIRGVWLKVFRNDGSTVPGTVTVSIKAVDGSSHPTGVDLCIATFNGNEVPYLGSGGAGWLWVPFTTSPWLNNATRYAIVVRCATGGLYWRSDNSSPSYTGGNREYSTNAGTSWTSDVAKDYMFKVGYTLDDMTLFPASLAVGDAYYWGYDLPFERVLQDISVPAGGDYALAFDYSQGGGAWATCIDLADDTNRFQTYGLGTISHSPQGDWNKDTVLGKNLYWLRARCTDAGTDYVQPKAGYAKVGKNY